MNYESIILEMFTRIKTLEDQVKILKDEVEDLEQIPSSQTALAPEAGEETPARQGSTGRVNQKMSDERVELCYQCGRRAYQGEKTGKLADEIVEKSGMNRNSAVIYLGAVTSMLRGTGYKRSISLPAMEYFFQVISRDDGADGLEKALQASRQYSAYHRAGGHNTNSIDELCKKYEALLQDLRRV